MAIALSDALRARYSGALPDDETLRQRVLEICQWYIDAGLGDADAKLRLASADDAIYWQQLSEVLIARELVQAGLAPSRRPSEGPAPARWSAFPRGSAEGRRTAVSSAGRRRGSHTAPQRQPPKTRPRFGGPRGPLCAVRRGVHAVAHAPCTARQRRGRKNAGGHAPAAPVGYLPCEGGHGVF